jgi:trehalose 6-phosphate phosphatase
MNPSMRKDIEVIGIPDFWTRLRGAGNRFIALDYDGTLAPFRSERMEAYPLPGISDILATIADNRRTFLAVISGRPISELSVLLGVDGIMLIGSHGFELMTPDGAITVTRPTAGQLQALMRAEATAAELGFGRELEVKVASVAFHTRGMSAKTAAMTEALIHEKWSRLASSDLECRRFDGGIEIRASGRHKGDALRELLDRLPPGTFSVFVGDDETDEDAFRALQGRGIGIKVGNPAIPTAAAGFLPSCEAVRDFLGRWASILSAEGD